MNDSKQFDFLIFINKSIQENLTNLVSIIMKWFFMHLSSMIIISAIIPKAIINHLD